MGHRRKINNLKKIEKDCLEGRGKGAGENYKPGIYTYEIPSKGKVARVKGFTVGRVHHCLSQHEKYFLLLLDYDPYVEDIREQFPLELEDTLLIAAEHGISHPYADGYPARMTTDFYYCRSGVWYAVAIKQADALTSKRVCEKLKIEQLYWEQKGVNWRLVTDDQIPRQLAVNLQWLHSGEPVEILIPDSKFRENLKASFISLYQNYSIPFREIIDTIEEYCDFRPGTVIQMFKQLILEKEICIDLSQKIDPDEPRVIRWI